MFTVNMGLLEIDLTRYEFQNISCLRLIGKEAEKYYDDLAFQNISCLRLIKYGKL